LFTAVEPEGGDPDFAAWDEGVGEGDVELRAAGAAFEFPVADVCRGFLFRRLSEVDEQGSTARAPSANGIAKIRGLFNDR
jgi:hypothetical protein